MHFLELPAAFACAVLLLGALAALVRRAAPGRFFHDARELIDELRAPQIGLALYLAAWLWLFFRPAGEAPQALKTAEVAVEVTGAIALLRLADMALFAVLRALGRSASRIVRSLLLWVLTAVVIAAGARAAWQFDLGSLLTTSALLSVVLGFALQEPLEISSPGSPSTPSTPSRPATG